MRMLLSVLLLAGCAAQATTDESRKYDYFSSAEWKAKAAAEREREKNYTYPNLGSVAKTEDSGITPSINCYTLRFEDGSSSTTCR